MAKSATFFINQSPVVIDAMWIEKLRRTAQDNSLKRARICLHKRDDSQIQEMLIAACRDAYIRPHRQKSKEKSYVVIEGIMSVLFFNSTGEVVKKIEMSDIRAGKTSICRFNSEQWHMINVSSDIVLYLETIQGPFTMENTEYAPWSPKEKPR